jgi:hypothetical protein
VKTAFSFGTYRPVGAVGEGSASWSACVIGAISGLQLEELLALRRRDVNFAGHALTVGRAVSAGVESSRSRAGSVESRCPTSTQPRSTE